MVTRTFGLLRDLGFAAKSLRRTPGFTLIAVVTLALGIGANTAMFSAFDGYLLRPTPYPDSDRLERIYRATERDRQGGVAPADYLELRSAAQGYGDIAAYAATEMSLSEPGRAAEITYGLRSSANLFSTLGTEPQLGRGFRREEEVFGNHRVLVISHRYWQVRFGGSSDVVGRAVRVDGEPYEIVGVLPENFSDWRHLSWVEAFRPLGLDEQERRERIAPWLHLVGRRAPQLTHAQAAGHIDAFGRRLAAEFPAANAETWWHTVPIDESFVDQDGRAIMIMLVGLSGFVLLIVCSNLANLLLARTMARARELAMRTALGASRTQTLRPLFAESLLLALGGGVGATFVAQWTFDWLAVVSAGDSGVGINLVLNWRRLAWTFGVCVFTAVAFGLAPALFARRLDLNATLKSGSRGTTGDRGHRRFRHALIVGQLALATVLLAGAAQFERGLHELNNRRHGWESADLVTGAVVFPAVTYASDEQLAARQRVVLQRLEALPGVTSASFSYAMPFFGLAEPRKYLVAGRDAPRAGHEPTALINGVSPRYFETVGTRLLAGRSFAESDDIDAPRVFVINEAMARGLFGDANPLGQRLAQAGSEAPVWGEIVGVVADVESVFSTPSLASFQLYLPLAQEPRRTSEIAVRTTGVAPSGVIDAIRTTMLAIDPDLPVHQLQPAVTSIERANYQDGVLATILSAMALLGLGLATLGVYGVVSRTVAQRTGEFGIRMAVGARASDILRLVLGSGTKLSLVGSALGLLGAAGVTRLLIAGFPGMRIGSVPVLAGSTLLLIVIAQLACYLPARQAAKVNPSRTLWAD